MIFLLHSINNAIVSQICVLTKANTETILKTNMDFLILASAKSIYSHTKKRVDVIPSKKSLTTDHTKSVNHSNQLAP